MTYREAGYDRLFWPVVTSHGMLGVLQCIACGDRDINPRHQGPCPRCGATLDSELSEFHIRKNREAKERLELFLVAKIRGWDVQGDEPTEVYRKLVAITEKDHAKVQTEVPTEVQTTTPAEEPASGTLRPSSPPDSSGSSGDSGVGPVRPGEAGG